MTRAKDIMKTEVITVSPQMSVEALGRLFIERDISGAPVVDEEGRLVGIVTENDLISQNKRLHIPTILRLFDAFIPLGGTAALQREIQKMAARTVGEICTKEVITIQEDTPLEDIATTMAERRVHLLPVLREGKVVGIVGRHEVIRAASGEAPEEP
jgi:CBS domain-containing protein